MTQLCAYCTNLKVCVLLLLTEHSETSRLGLRAALAAVSASGDRDTHGAAPS